MQSLIQPGRAQNEQRLANNLFASGRMGQGTAAYEGGGYLNPERMEYLTAMNREDNKMAFDAQSRARQERLNDMQTGMGYYGMGNQMRLDPYNDMYKMFAYGSDIEKMGQVPLNMGQSLGSAAQSGNQAMAQMYGMGAQARLGSDLAGAGMFTKLLGAGASAIPDGTFSNLMGGGGTSTMPSFGSGGGMPGGGYPPTNTSSYY